MDDFEKDLPAEVLDGNKPVIFRKEAVVKPGDAIKRARQVSFLQAFAECGNLTEACKAAGINKTTERNWRATDKWYVDQFKDAFQAYRDLVSSTVRRRAIDGIEVPIIGKVQTELGPEDRIIGHKTVYSDLLLMFEAKRVDPAYKEKYEAPNESDKPVESISPLTRITITLDAMQTRQNTTISIASGGETQSQGALPPALPDNIIDVTPEASE